MNTGKLNEEASILKATDEEIETIGKEHDIPELTPEEMIAKWKVLYQKIYLSVYDEQEFIWRKVKRNEYVEIMDQTPDDEHVTDVVEYRQQKIIMACVLSPVHEEDIIELLDEYPGLLTSLSAEILKKSGFSKPLTIEI